MVVLGARVSRPVQGRRTRPQGWTHAAIATDNYKDRLGISFRNRFSGVTAGASVGIGRGKDGQAPAVGGEHGQADVPGHVLEPLRAGVKAMPCAGRHLYLDLCGTGAFGASGEGGQGSFPARSG